MMFDRYHKDNIYYRVRMFFSKFVFHSPSNARVFVNLLFRGDVQDAEDHIQLILDSHLRRLEGTAYDVALIDDFIVDVTGHRQITTPTQGT